MIIDLNDVKYSITREADIGGSFENIYQELHLMLLLAIVERLEVIAASLSSKVIIEEQT